MLTLLAVAGLLLSETPNEVYGRASSDLFRNVAPDKRRVTRYLSLQAYPEADRMKVIQSLDFAINSLSWRSTIVHGVIVGGDRLLYQIDTEALGWDRESRIAQRAEWEKRGVKFAFKDQHEEARFLDPWESMAAREPYFKTSQINARHELIRGWIDPILEERTRLASYSSNLVLRADWFLAHSLTEKDRGGFYSLLLMIPQTEQELYKVLLIPIETVERAAQLRYGGAVAKSIVAFHNRGLEVFYSPYGRGAKYFWRTYDVLRDDLAEKNVNVSLGGTLKHDGRETIGSLPNGMQFYGVYDGKGKQVEVVPQGIAIDMRRDTLDQDRNVINAVKCVSCHEAGINPYEDRIGFSILHPQIGLGTFSYDRARASGRAYELSDYYRIAEKGGLAREVLRHQEAYAEAMLDVNEMTPEDNARRVIGWYDAYVYRLIGLNQAAREMGLTIEQAREALRHTEDPARHTPDSTLVVLSSDQQVSRTQWEASFGNAMRAQVFPWEHDIQEKPRQPKQTAK